MTDNGDIIEAYAFIKSGAQVIQECADILTAFQNSGAQPVSDFLRMADYALARTPNGTLDLAKAKHIRPYYDNAYSSLRNLTRKLYRRLAEANNADGFFTAEMAERNYYDAYEAGTNDTVVRIFPDGIWVKTLSILPRRKPSASVSHGIKQRLDYDDFLSKSITRAISFSPELPSLQRELFTKKHVHFLFICPINQRHAPDNDNRDVKEIIDALTWFVGGDAAFCCSLSYSAKQSDSGFSGTYITVSPGSMQSIPDDEILAFWNEAGTD